MINRVILVGRLTKEITLRKTQAGTSVVAFTVACNRRFSGKGQEQQADFINCVAWNQSADFLAQYATKGALIGVEGRIQTRNYEDQTGKRVYVTEVVCDSVQILESRQAAQNRGGANAGYQQNTGYQADNSYQDTSSYGAEDNFDFDTGPTLDISSDDLPF